MQDRIAYQGITFDDVLLEPALQRRRAARRRCPHPADAQHPPQHPHRLVADGHGHRERPGHRAGPGRAASASSTRTCRSPIRPARWTRSSAARTASSPTRSRCRPTRRSAPPASIMEQHNISGVPITVNGYLKGILTRRDLRFLTDNNQKLAEVMTKDNLVTAPENTTLEAAERILTANKVEKLLLVDDKYRLKGLITIKDIDKLTQFPQRLQGPARPAARRGGGRRPRLRAGRVADPGRRGCAGGRFGPRPLAATCSRR